MTRPTPLTFDVRCEGTDVAITMYGHIGPSLFGDEDGLTAQRVMDVLAANKSATQITLNINSPGGLMFEALAMYNALRRHPARKVVNIDGYAASAASLVAMAGDQINIAANGMVMIHDPINLVLGNAADFRKAAEDLDKQAEPAVTTYAARTGNSAAQIRAWMRDTTWFTADECKTHKFADEITPAKSVAACDLSAYRYAKLPPHAAVAATARPPDAADRANKTSAATAAAQPATLAELKTIPGSTAAFRERAREHGLTLAAATDLLQREAEAEKNSSAHKTVNEFATASDSVREVNPRGYTSPFTTWKGSRMSDTRLSEQVREMKAALENTDFLREVRRLQDAHNLDEETAMRRVAHGRDGNRLYLEYRAIKLAHVRQLSLPPVKMIS